jgi:hypothetical protein
MVSVDCLSMSSKAAPVAARFVAAGLMLVGWGAFAGVAAADPTPDPSPAASASPSPAPAPAASPSPAGSPKTTMDHDGTYAVGTDLVPGIYSSAGPVGTGTCYWKRMANPDGALIDNAISKKPQVVQIDANDKAFKTSGCQTWQLTPDATLPTQASTGQVQGTLGIIGALLGGGAQQAPQPSQQAPSPSQQGPPPGPPPGQQAPQS